jgi:hypothetical protein
MVPPDRFFDDPRGDLLLESTDRRFARVQSDVLRREIRSANDWLPDDLQTLPELMPEGTPMLSMQGDAASLQLLLTHALCAEANEQPLAFEHARRCVARSTVRKQHLTFVRYPPRRLVDLADEYDSPRALASGMRQLARHVSSHPPTVFAIAAAHGDIDVCRLALRHFDVPLGGRPASSLIPADLADALAPSVRQNLDRLGLEALGLVRSRPTPLFNPWPDLAHKFTVRPAMAMAATVRPYADPLDCPACSSCRRHLGPPSACLHGLDARRSNITSLFKPTFDDLCTI